MKQIIILLFALFSVFVSRADERGEKIVARMGQAVGVMKHYEIRFEASGEGMEAVSGAIVVSGARYNIQLLDNEQFSDGKYKYDVLTAQKEVVIDRIDAASHNILNNPARAFSFATYEFTARSLSATQVELTPKSNNAGMGRIIISVAAASGLPTELVYDYDGQQIRIAISSFVSLAKVDEALFRYTASKYKGWDVIDFRHN